MYILGINAYHGDSSACLLKDGEIIFAVEEERFNRIKHWAGFPSESIKHCLMYESIQLRDVEHIAINQDSSANLWNKIGYTLSKKPEIGFVINKLKNKKKRDNVLAELEKNIGNDFKGKIHNIEHHLAHLSSAYHVSPFDNSVIVSVDGFGDFASTAWGIGENEKITMNGKIFFPHSLGIFYQAMTQWLGFSNYGDEYKVMGLAPYGDLKYLDKMKDIVHLKEDGTFELNLKYFRHHSEVIEYEWSDGTPKFKTLFTNQLEELIGLSRRKDEKLTQYHMDIARSVQAMYEKSFFNLLNSLFNKYENHNLSLAGGCAMNSVANGKIYQNTKFKNIYIQSAPGDAGGAIGAACSVWFKFSKNKKFIMEHAYLGLGFSNNQIEELIVNNEQLRNKNSFIIKKYDKSEELCNKVAFELSTGKVVGWFQGRMEWGPRALGNRSIICDPRRSDMKEILNLKIKRRESFRPFAPSIIIEEVENWFEENDNVPFMMQVYPIKEDKRHLVPAVTHVDGSGRLQTVSRSNNNIYYDLIKSFFKLTGVPMILNTSFNENEPIVCLPEEALNTFLRTKMDTLVLENWMITRK